MKKSLINSVLVLVLFMFVSGFSQASTHLVTSDSEFISAMEIYADGDTILMAPGEYSADVSISRSVTLRGQTGSPDDVIIMRSAAVTSLVEISGPALVRLEGLLIREHRGTSALADVYFATLEVRNCRFIGNSSVIGGGAIRAEDCSLEITDCSLVQNVCSTNGGALFVDGGSLVMDDCDIASNIAGNDGGGLEIKAVEAVIGGCRLEDNTANDTAGALHVWAGSILEMNSTLIAGNSVHIKSGGMVVQGSSTATLSECTFADNDGPLSDDGNIGLNCSALFQCCYLDLDQWVFSGTVEIDDSGCQVATQQETLGGLKAIYR